MSDEWDKLRLELGGLIKQIDGEGLLFLKKQATTLIYNATIQEINQKNQESLLQNHWEKESGEALEGTVEDKDTPVIKERKDNFDPKELYIDMGGEPKGYCNIVCGKVRVFFTLDELDSLIYIAERTGSRDGGLLLYRWLKKERGDFLVDNGIKSYPSPIIDYLVKLLAAD